MADWLDGIALETPYATLLDALRAAYREAVIWTAPADTPPDGYKRFNATGNRFEVYDAASSSWLALALDASWQGYAGDVGYVSANVIRLNTNVTATMTAGRRLKIYLASSTVLGTVLSSAYASGQDTTDVTLKMDGAGVDATISKMEIGQDPASLAGKYDKTGGLIDGAVQMSGLVEARAGLNVNGGTLTSGVTMGTAADTNVNGQSYAWTTNNGAGNRLQLIRHAYRTVAGADWLSTILEEAYLVDASVFGSTQFRFGNNVDAATRAYRVTVDAQYHELRSGGTFYTTGPIAFGQALTTSSISGPANGNIGFSSGLRLSSDGQYRRVLFTDNNWRLELDATTGSLVFVDYNSTILWTARGDGWFFSTNGLQAPQITSTGNINANGGIAAAGDITAFSDERVKTDIEPIADALELVEQLRGCRFLRTDRLTLEIGMIAQEVEAVLPEVVTRPASDQQMYAVDYGKTTALLVEAIKALSTRVKALEAANTKETAA